MVRKRLGITGIKPVVKILHHICYCRHKSSMTCDLQDDSTFLFLFQVSGFHTEGWILIHFKKRTQGQSLSPKKHCWQQKCKRTYFITQRREKYTNNGFFLFFVDKTTLTDFDTKLEYIFSPVTSASTEYT